MHGKLGVCRSKWAKSKQKQFKKQGGTDYWEMVFIHYIHLPDKKQKIKDCILIGKNIQKDTFWNECGSVLEKISRKVNIIIDCMIWLKM